MEDKEFKLSDWIMGHTLRQHREQIASFKKDIEDNCRECRLKEANVLLYVADAVLDLFDRLDRRSFTSDVKDRIDKAGASLREQYELYSLELGQDMAVLESLGSDDPEVGTRVDEIRRGLDQLQETIRDRVKDYETSGPFPKVHAPSAPANASPSGPRAA